MGIKEFTGEQFLEGMKEVCKEIPWEYDCRAFLQIVDFSALCPG